MKYSPKTLLLFSYWYATKDVINKISHILQQSTYHPRLQILPLPPILPQSQNQNILSPKITSTSAPYPSLEPVVQTLRVKTLTSATTAPPRVNPSTSPTFYPRSNQWIKKI